MSEEEIFEVLSHPKRRSIIRFIGDQEVIGFKEIREFSRLGVGTLYYHLHELESLLKRDSSRKYMLSSRGLKAYRLIVKGFDGSAQVLDRPRVWTNRVLGFMTFHPVSDRILENPIGALPFLVVLALLGGVGSFLVGLQPELLFYTQPDLVELSRVIGSSFLRWIYLFVISQGVTRYFFHQRREVLALFCIIPITLIPLSLFPVVWTIITLLDLHEIVLLNLILQMSLQTWSLVILALELEGVKRVRFSEAILTVLLAQYCNILLLWGLRFTGLI